MQIERFENLADYIAAQPAKGGLAAVPITLVADYLDLTPPAVVAMLTDGRLNGVRIDKTTLVTLASLEARQAKRAGEEVIIYEYLRNRTKDGERVVFYEPVMAEVGMTPRVPAHRGRIGTILGKVSERSYAEDGVLLSVLVHQKKAGITRPGKGFFDLARHLGYEWMDDNAFIKAETDKVMKAYG